MYIEGASWMNEEFAVIRVHASLLHNPSLALSVSVSVM